MAIAIKNVGPIEQLAISVPPGGGVTVLRGRNGSGKTTALRAAESVLRGEGKLGVPAGTTGYVVEDYGRGITIAWDMADRPYPLDKTTREVASIMGFFPGAPLRDGFSIGEMQYLEVIQKGAVK
jgi:ABC-type Na+ transport system ATPase subunit NatA